MRHLFNEKSHFSLEISREIKNDEGNKENRVIFQKWSKSQGDSSLKTSFFERFKNIIISIGNPCFFKPPQKSQKHTITDALLGSKNHVFFKPPQKSQKHTINDSLLGSKIHVFFNPSPQTKSQKHTINDVLIGSEGHFYLKILKKSKMTGN